MSTLKNEWQIYRTRFLVKAKQLNKPLVFVDPLGREQCGEAGDYLVEWSDGLRRILPREFFEDAYVSMGPVDDNRMLMARGKPPVPSYPMAPLRRFALSCDS